MSGNGRTGLTRVSVTGRISVDASVSYRSPGDDQKDPFPFKQWIVMPVPWCLSCRARHLELPVRGVHPGGKDSRITAHFPACLAAETCSLDCLSSAICALVRSSSTNILLGSENSFRLALRAQSLSVAFQNLIKRVESWCNIPNWIWYRLLWLFLCFGWWLLTLLSSIHSLTYVLFVNEGVTFE